MIPTKRCNKEAIMQQQTTFIELPSAPRQAIYKTIQQIGKSNIPIFITGETGVGKESIARYIHESGPRRAQPFIAINCGRFSAELLQSELFGHEAGRSRTQSISVGVCLK